MPLERKDAALLALLAFDGPQPRGEAAALLWPDADAAHARNSLRQRLFRLQGEQCGILALERHANAPHAPQGRHVDQLDDRRVRQAGRAGAGGRGDEIHQRPA